MSQRRTRVAFGEEDASLLRLGGASALAIFAGYCAILVLYANAGAPPAGATAMLVHRSANTTLWRAIVGLSVFTDVLYVPVALALFVALRRVSRTAMLLACVFVALFVVLDLAVTWTNYAALISLSERFADAGAVAQATYATAAEYPVAILTSQLEPLYAIVTLSSGMLVAGAVMLRSQFGRTEALLGIVTGTLGVLSVTGWTPAIMGNALCATAWVLLVGIDLVRAGRIGSTEPERSTGTPALPAA